MHLLQVAELVHEVAAGVDEHAPEFVGELVHVGESELLVEGGAEDGQAVVAHADAAAVGEPDGRVVTGHELGHPRALLPHEANDEVRHRAHQVVHFVGVGAHGHHEGRRLPHQVGAVQGALKVSQRQRVAARRPLHEVVSPLQDRA